MNTLPSSDQHPILAELTIGCNRKGESVAAFLHCSTSKTSFQENNVRLMLKYESWVNIKV